MVPWLEWRLVRKNMLRAVVSDAISFVYQAGTTDAAGDWSIDITGLGHQSGDVGILAFSSDVSDGTMSILGFTLVSADTTSGNCITSLYRRDMDGAETSVASFNAGSMTETAVSLFVIRGVTTTGIDIATAAGTNSNPDPGQGAVVTGEEAMSLTVIATGGAAMTDLLTSTGYTTMTGQLYPTGNEATIAGAYKVITAQDDPDAPNYAPDVDWVSYTVTLQEA